MNSFLSSNSLREAAAISEQIEKLQVKLQSVLGVASTAPKGPRPAVAPDTQEVAPTIKTRKTRGSAGRRRSPLSGKTRPASPSGPLGPAVIAVLKKNGKPMAVADILKGLETAKYVWTAKDPKATLHARIHTLKGVKKVAVGRFVAA